MLAHLTTSPWPPWVGSVTLTELAAATVSLTELATAATVRLTHTATGSNCVLLEVATGHIALLATATSST